LGIPADGAATIAMATDRLMNYRYEVLIVDNQLFDGSGLSLVQRLRNGDFGSAVVDVTAILISGVHLSEWERQRVEGLRLLFFQKPFSIADLVTLIRPLLPDPS
jgi:DNA-binding response OmpR family regulator